VLSSETTQGQVDVESVDAVLIAMLSVESELTTFEYLTGCWKRLYRVNREVLKAVSWNELGCLGLVTDRSCDSTNKGYSAENLTEWKSMFDKLKDLIVSYAGYTLEDPSMFPQPAG